MANVRIVLDSEGIEEIQKSDGVRAVENEYAGTVYGRLKHPEDYETEQRTTDRAVVVIHAATVRARIDCRRNNTLLKAGGV